VGSLSSLEVIFLGLAVLGALGAVARLVTMLAGMDGDDGDDGDDFQVLSVQGLSSFFLMSGLVGIALARQTGAGAVPSLLGGFLAGAATVGILARVFRLAQNLQSSGTIPPRAAVGCLGTVHERIPERGTGRVNVRIGQRIREMDAEEASGGGLPTGTPIRVVRVERSLAIVQSLSQEM